MYVHVHARVSALSLIHAESQFPGSVYGGILLSTTVRGTRQGAAMASAQHRGKADYFVIFLNDAEAEQDKAQDQAALVSCNCLALRGY